MLIRVFYREDKVVTTISGDAFIRVGDQKHQLTTEEIHELKIDKNQLDLEQETANLNFPDDFDVNLVGRFANSIKSYRRLLTSHSDEEILTQRRLGKTTTCFTPNNACVLLFAKDPISLFPGCKIRFLRYEGTQEKTGEQYNVVKDIPIEGPIPHLIAEAEDVLRSQLRQFSHLAWISTDNYLPKREGDFWHSGSGIGFVIGHSCYPARDHCLSLSSN